MIKKQFVPEDRRVNLKVQIALVTAPVSQMPKPCNAHPVLAQSLGTQTNRAGNK